MPARLVRSPLPAKPPRLAGAAMRLNLAREELRGAIDGGGLERGDGQIVEPRGPGHMDQRARWYRRDPPDDRLQERHKHWISPAAISRWMRSSRPCWEDRDMIQS